MDQFKLVALYQPAGGQGAAIDSLLRSINQGGAGSNFIGCDRIRKNFYHGQCDCQNEPSHARHCPQ